MKRAHRSYLVLLLSAAACVGTIEEASAPPQAEQTAASVAEPAARDVNRVDLHRLNNSEYHNTMRDLLGVDSTPAASFIGDEKAHGFDNIAAALGMTDAQYEQYWNAADSLIEATFADPKLRARIVTCDPGTRDASACTSEIIRSFGLRAFRRPLAQDELASLADLAADARAMGEPFERTIALVAGAMLASPQFLYRVELDADPSSAAAHPLDPYELASRLSYLVWSSMPDQALFDAAASGKLSELATLTRELDRMLEDPRADAFVASFAGQWLGMRELQSHTVDKALFPEWSEPLRDALVREGLSYFDEFFRGRRSLEEFFTAQLHVADAALAKLYGVGGVNATVAERQGFMGLAGFLTLTSFSYRTAPTLRGKWVLENLLCESVAPPPANVPQLEDGAAKSGEDASLNVRERLAEHRTNPACAACHNLLDPIGFGLERFDAIGRYRERYSAAEPIDSTGTLPNGAAFDGLLELSELLASDQRLADCASRKLLTYALARAPTASDDPYLAEIRAASSGGGSHLRSLLTAIVQSDLFRMRRGEPE